MYLNVYTPNTVNGDNFPVMFWIHGGGFSTGHSSPETYGPDYFMDRNVVLVSANYRLGVLGITTSGISRVPRAELKSPRAPRQQLNKGPFKDII